MFVRHTVDDDGRFQHLFWCDWGKSNELFSIWRCTRVRCDVPEEQVHVSPVIFFGVNHHNQKIVFATGLVSNETE